MIERFELGKYYYYKGHRQDGWSSLMEFMLDGNPRKAINIPPPFGIINFRGEIETIPPEPDRVAFEGQSSKVEGHCFYWGDLTEFYEYKKHDIDELVKTYNSIKGD